MATHELPIIGHTVMPQSGVYWDKVGNQVTATNEFGNQLSIVMADGGTDEGFYGSFTVPQNYVGTPKVVVKGILDGAMSSVTLQFGIQGITKADNEAVDAAYSAEDTGNNSDDHADEDLVVVTITLSNFTGFAVGDTVFYYFFIDATGTYAGNFLLTDLLFQYADA